jgi:hypothetical protein
MLKVATERTLIEYLQGLPGRYPNLNIERIEFSFDSDGDVFIFFLTDDEQNPNTVASLKRLWVKEAWEAIGRTNRIDAAVTKRSIFDTTKHWGLRWISAFGGM